MAADTGRIETDPLFLGLTRPAMLLGVTYSWFAIEGLVWLLYFVNLNDFKVIIYAAITHFLGRTICKFEPRFVELVMAWSQTWPKCRNRRYHGYTGSYDLY